MYSSTALSTISHTRWCRPRLSVPPMYMAGRRRTGSSPSRTVRSRVVYFSEARRDGRALIVQSPIVRNSVSTLLVLALCYRGLPVVQITEPDRCIDPHVLKNHPEHNKAFDVAGKMPLTNSIFSGAWCI